MLTAYLPSGWKPLEAGTWQLAIWLNQMTIFGKIPDPWDEAARPPRGP